MVADDTVATEVPDKSVALNNASIRENSSSKYPPIFWSGYKHHVRGLLTGTILGATIGAIIGLALIPVLGPFGPLVGAGTGLIFGAQQVGSIGAASGSRAEGLAMRHASALDPANEGDPEKIANDKLVYDGREQHHYEYPKERDDNKFFSWKSGLVGTLIGASAGAIIGKVLAGMTIVSHVAAFSAIMALGPAAPIVAGALVFGMLGLTFGIERGLFKNVFNWVSELTEGKKSPEVVNHVGPEPALGKESGDQLLAHQWQRREDEYDLKTKYDEKIFRGSVRGYIKGAIGGSLIGAFFGAAVGLIAVGIMAAFAPVSIGVIIGLFAGAGALYGIATFGGAGYEAGAEATARAIDDEFQVERARSAKGLPTPEMTPVQEPQKGAVAVAFDKVMNFIGLVSNGSKKVYNSAYDPEVMPIPPNLLAQMPRPPQQNYTVTPEEAATLGQRLNNNDKKNFADIITQPQPAQPTIPPL